jgi:hypothetical protein
MRSDGSACVRVDAASILQGTRGDRATCLFQQPCRSRGARAAAIHEGQDPIGCSAERYQCTVMSLSSWRSWSKAAAPVSELLDVDRHRLALVAVLVIPISPALGQAQLAWEQSISAAATDYPTSTVVFGPAGECVIVGTLRPASSLAGWTRSVRE